MGPKKKEDCRCGCGALICRLTEAGVEIRCRRCKTITFIPYSGMEKA
jgi:phage FluMu protein Com